MTDQNDAPHPPEDRLRHLAAELNRLADAYNGRRSTPPLPVVSPTEEEGRPSHIKAVAERLLLAMKARAPSELPDAALRRRGAFPTRGFRYVFDPHELMVLHDRPGPAPRRPEPAVIPDPSSRTHEIVEAVCHEAALHPRRKIVDALALIHLMVAEENASRARLGLPPIAPAPSRSTVARRLHEARSRAMRQRAR